MSQLSRALSGNPLRFLEHEHTLHLQFCDLLEQIADDLPDNVGAERAKSALISLESLRPHHQFEEGMLFPLLRRRVKERDNAEPILRNFEAEHSADESLALELSEELDVLAAGAAPRNAHLTGYMLRAFFVSYRRHIAWENVLLLPLAHQRLTEEDLDQLSAQLQKSAPADLAENRTN